MGVASAAAAGPDSPSRNTRSRTQVRAALATNAAVLPGTQANGLPAAMRSMAAPKKKGNEKPWIKEQFLDLGADGLQCKHCPPNHKPLSGKNTTRNKQHLLNPKACAFLASKAAVEIAKHDKDVRDELNKYKAVQALAMSGGGGGQRQLTKVVDKLSSAEKAVLDSMVADYHYELAIPFHVSAGVGNFGALQHLLTSSSHPTMGSRSFGLLRPLA